MTSNWILEPGASSLTITCRSLPVSTWRPSTAVTTSPCLQACAACGRVRGYRSDQCSAVAGEVEELRVVRSYIVEADSQVSVMDHAVLDQRLHHRVHCLGRNGEAGARERSGVRDQEGVDADQFAMGIHQRATGVAGVDGCIRLDKSTRLASIIRVRVRPVDRADDARA